MKEKERHVFKENPIKQKRYEMEREVDFDFESLPKISKESLMFYVFLSP